MLAVYFCASPDNIRRVYGGGAGEQIAALAPVYPHIIQSAAMLREHREGLRDTEVIFTTWGMPSLTPADLGLLPNLKAVFYAAGSVKGFAQPFLEAGVRVVSAWRANALPVAEFTLAHILLAGCGYFRNVREYRRPEREGQPYVGGGSYGETVGLIAAGAVGRRLAALLRPYDFRVLVYDPYLSEAGARELGVEKADLPVLFRESLVVSNHLPLLPETRGMIGEELLRQMREGATFINTGRGATVDEGALVRTAMARPDLNMVLDVTTVEPPPADSPLYRLPNVLLSSHIAGSKGNELYRMADACVEAFRRYLAGEPMGEEVTLPMLRAMA